MSPPGGRASSLLALMLLLALLAAAWQSVASPLLDWHAARAEDLRNRQALLLRMRALAGSVPRLENAVAAQGHAGPFVPIEGASDALASAGLQAAMQDMAAAANVRLVSAETLPAEARGAYRGIRLRLAVVAPWPALLDFLAALDSHPARILVDELGLRTATTFGRAGEAPIEAGLTVMAFRAGAAPR